MSSPTKKHTKKSYFFLHRSFILTCVLIIVVIGPFLFYNAYFIGRVFPNIYVAGIDISGATINEAEAKILVSSPQNPHVDLIYLQKKHTLTQKDIDLKYNHRASAVRAYGITRTGNLFLDSITRTKLLFTPKRFGLDLELNNEKLNREILKISEEISKPAKYPSIKKVGDTIEIDKGSQGLEVDTNDLIRKIEYELSQASQKSIAIPFVSVDPTLTEIEAENLKFTSQKYLGKSIIINFESKTFIYKDEDLLNLLNPKGGFNNKELANLAKKIEADTEREPQNPKFEFNGTRVTEFAPALDGISLDSQKFIDTLTISLEKLARDTDVEIAFDLPTQVTKPEVATAEINNFGIKEMIGRGTSTYFHSIPGRVFNVNLASQRINGTLIAPGETFSFNKALGDVSKFTGYKEAYVIQNGRTVLGDGGGVCQVSSTLFRAVLNAGLPINERSAHAYRVGYYEQNSPPGLDATVFAPSPDFKFTNDTGSHILIQAKNDSSNYSLEFELYGAKDGRIAQVTKPVISNYSPALPTIYQDDPTLPAGTLKQTDYAAAGARVSFNYSVKKDGVEIFTKTFVSNYRPWAAVYLRGTKTN